jgi:predicted transcriptional regulator
MDKIEEIARRVAEGQHPHVRVRELISWFGFTRRHAWAVGSIRRDLRKYNLRTVPDFDWTYLDAEVTFAPLTTKTSTVSNSSIEIITQEVMEPTDAIGIFIGEVIEPTYRIGRLDIGKVPPLSVAPDILIDEAVGLMLRHDFSQLPAMTTERVIKGIFSWRTLGSIRAWGRSVSAVRDAMDQRFEVVTEDASLFDVIARIDRSDCVLVQDASTRIVGIITPYDITKTFGRLGEPFLVLGEIENHIRSLLEGKFTREELVSVRDPEDRTRAIEKVSDLTFGEYLRLLEKPEYWGRLGLRIPRAGFVKELELIRQIRNGVMHFDPDGVEEADLTRLREFVEFLRKIQRLRPQ